jgi:BON domain
MTVADGHEVAGEPSEAPVYEAEHLRAALATDPGVMQPGLDVSVTADVVVVRGCVPTEAVRDAVAAVAGNHLGRRRLVNDVEVTPNAEPDGTEELG